MPLLPGNTELTSKEWAIAALVSNGYTDAQIAVVTQIREPLVEDHLRKIFQKTGCWNRSEIAVWYLKIGVEKERRSHDRREESWEITEERRTSGRRQGF